MSIKCAYKSPTKLTRIRFDTWVRVADVEIIQFLTRIGLFMSFFIEVKLLTKRTFVVVVSVTQLF